MPVGTLKNLLPYLIIIIIIKRGALFWFFCRQSEPENIQGPLPGRVKPTAQRLRSNRSHKIIERYQDSTQTRAAVLSEVRPENNYV